MLPSSVAGEQQVGHVGAGDEQHKCHGHKQHPRCLVRSRDCDAVKPTECDPLAVIYIGIHMRQTGRYSAHFRSCLLSSHSRGKPTDRADVIPATVQVRNSRYKNFSSQLPFELLRREVEPLWQDPHHRIIPTVQVNELPKDRRVSCESPLPQPVTQEGNMPTVTGTERPAQARMNT